MRKTTFATASPSVAMIASAAAGQTVSQAIAAASTYRDQDHGAADSGHGHLGHLHR